MFFNYIIVSLVWAISVFAGWFLARKTNKPFVLKLDKSIIMGIFVGILLGIFAFVLVLIWEQFRQNIFIIVTEGGKQPNLFWRLILVPIGTGIVQEIWFRGLLQQHFGILKANLIFAAIHFFPFVGLTFPLLAFLGGLIFGWLFQKTGNLAVPIAVHALVVFFFTLPFYLIY